MPGIEDQPPSADQVSIIRQKFQEYIAENGKGMQIILSGLNQAFTRHFAWGSNNISNPVVNILFYLLQIILMHWTFNVF